MEGVTALGDAIHDNRAISTLNLMNSGLTSGVLKAYPGQFGVGNEGYRPEAERGTKDSDFDADMSGIIALANAIPDMRALTSLDISSNMIGYLTVPKGWEMKKNTMDDRQIFKPPGAEWSFGPPNGAQPEGVIALANAIPDMGALIKLDISGNQMGREEERDLQRICVAGGIELAK
jgi:hypothetical protein